MKLYTSEIREIYKLTKLSEKVQRQIDKQNLKMQKLLTDSVIDKNADSCKKFARAKKTLIVLLDRKRNIEKEIIRVGTVPENIFFY